jgi:Protein of unknown function (DUF3106)
LKLRRQFGGWLCALGLSAALLLASPCVTTARQHPKDRPPHPAPERKAESPRNDRPPNANNGGNGPRYYGNGSRPPGGTPQNLQRRWQNLTPQERQRLSQNEQRLRNLPPAQQQVLRDRAQVWSRLTPEQRDHVRNDVLPKWKSMSPDRRQAIRQRLQVLQNMPEGARNQRLNDPAFTRGMSEEDKATLRDLSHLHVGGGPEPPGD